MELNITRVYPDLLDLYADKGNAAVLAKRLRWRGVTPYVQCTSEASFSLEETDILLIGGGGKREQKIALDRLKNMKCGLERYIENSGVVLAVCGGFELLAELGLLDVRITHGERASGNKIISCRLDGRSFKMTGFENHTGRAELLCGEPLGEVLYGDGEAEGVVYKNTFGTYMHGPVLPQNPVFADILIMRALRKKYGGVQLLPAVDNDIEDKARENILSKHSVL